MTFRDMLVTCNECGRQFVFTVETQRRLAEQGREVSAPERCDACTRRVKFGDKLHGRLKWFNLEKGFGFIAEDGGGEVYVHRSGIPLTPEGTLPVLEDGQEVLYEVIDSPKGRRAVKVVPYHD